MLINYCINNISYKANLSFFTHDILLSIFKNKCKIYRMDYNGLLYRVDSIKEDVLLSTETIINNFPKNIPNIETTYLTKIGCFGLKKEHRQLLIDVLTPILEKIVDDFFLEHININELHNV